MPKWLMGKCVRTHLVPAPPPHTVLRDVMAVLCLLPSC